jgi:Flp pilus assembly protein TadD
LLGEAVASYRQAIELDPHYAAAQNNLGSALSRLGRIDDAIAMNRSATLLKPDNPKAYLNLLDFLYHHPDYDSRRLLQETQQWLSGGTQTQPGAAKDVVALLNNHT